MTIRRRHARTKKTQQTKFARLRTEYAARTRKTSGFETENVINLSQRQLSDDERAVLAKGLNFAVPPKKTPTLDIIAGVEKGLRRIRDQNSANYIRMPVRQTHVRAKRPPPNLERKQREAIHNLRNDSSIVILPADKGNATVLMDKETYDNKIHMIISEGNYSVIRRDPTKGIERKIREKLWSLVQREEISMDLYRRLRPEHCPSPYLYGVPKVHKNDVPLRPIVSTINSPTYELARMLTKVISPLAGNTSYFVKDAAHFVQILEKEETHNDSIMVSFDVKSLFTNVPVDEALLVIRDKLEHDETMELRTPLKVESIMELLTLCLKTTYFSYGGEYYQQNDGAAMGSPISPVVANIYMEFLEQEALETAQTKPDIWLRYVDDTFVHWPHSRSDLDMFLDHLNSLCPSIQFTMEIEDERKLPFLDVQVTRDAESGIFRTAVYRKPTHTDRYLHYESYHPAHVKTGVIRTLLQRSRRICNSEAASTKEMRHIQKVFGNNGYPTNFIRRAMNPKPTLDSTQEVVATVTIPYIRGTSESIRRILSKENIRVAFRSRTTVRSILTNVRPRISQHDKKGVVYCIPCQDCDKVYVGETGRTLNIRQKEHKRHLFNGNTEDSAVAAHAHQEVHDIDWENTFVLDYDDDFFKRKVKEALLIRQKSNFNQDSGLAVSPIWLSLL